VENNKQIERVEEEEGEEWLVKHENVERNNIDTINT
jgi:hypothetical protein